MGKANNGLLTFNIFLLIGIIFSGIVTMMHLTGSINLECFYDVGELYDIVNEDYRTSGEHWTYNFASEKIETDIENANHIFEVDNVRKNWNYVYLEVAGLSESTWWDVEFLDKNSQAQYTISLPIQNGRNILQLQEGAVYAVRIIVREPTSFAIKRIQFRERLQNFQWKDAPKTFVIVMIFYLLGILLLRNLVHYFQGLGDTSVRRELWIEAIQRTYICLLDKGGELFQGFSERGKALLRKLFFLASIVVVYFTMNKGWNWMLLTQRRQVVLLGICLLFVAFLSWERDKTINWRNPLVYSWFILWMMVIISEFVVEKRIQNLGIFMLVVMAPFYLAWNSMKKPERLLKDFLTSLRYSYWVGCIFCIFCRALIPGIRYTGIYKNPNIFAGYLVTVNIVFLTYLDENLKQDHVKYRILVENLLGLASIWGFLYLTQSITSLVAYILEWTVFIWKQFPNEKKRGYRKNLKKIILIFLFCLVFVTVPAKWCLCNVPNILGTSVIFKGELYQQTTGKLSLSMISEAAGTIGISERLLKKITSGEWYFLFTGRDEVWKIYIRQLNLFGHEGYLRCFGETKMHAHNALLQMMHYYGVFVAVPFVVMLYYSLKYSVQMIFSKSYMKMELFFLLTMVNYIVHGLTEDVATPYFYISWLTYYIAVGGVFCQLKKAET